MAFVSLFLVTFLAWGLEVQVPALSSPVMDLASMMSADEQKDLSDFAYEIYTNKGPQITILTVPDLQGFAIEDYSMAVVEKWQLGTKDAGNGLLVLISKADRKVRIEVGDGIEGEITDYETAKYTREVFPRYFREGDFHGALKVFMEDVALKFNIKKTDGTSLVRRAPARRGGFSGAGFLPLIIAFIFINMVFRKRAGVRGLASGIVGAGLGWFLLPGVGIGLLIVFFIVSMLLGFVGMNNMLHGSSMGGGSYRGGGGFGGGGFGGGGGGSWGGGGGGFSGGGSSGSW